MRLRTRAALKKGHADLPKAKTWVQVPCPPDYMLELVRLMNPDWNLHLEQIHTPESIDYFYSDEYPQKQLRDQDLHRVLWSYGGDEEQKSYSIYSYDKGQDGKVYSLAEREVVGPNTLSLEEARKVVAFASTTPAIKPNSRFLQFGFFSVMYRIAETWMLNFVQLPSEKSFVITREKNNPQVIIVTSTQELYKNDVERKRGNPCYIFHCPYRILEAEEKGFVRAEIYANKKYGLRMEKRFWEDSMLKSVRQQLGELESKDPDYATFSPYIPFLCDKRLIPLFARKFSELAGQKPELVDQVNHLIALCFDKRSKDLLAIAKELEKHQVHSNLRELTLLKKETRAYKRDTLAVIRKELKKSVKAHHFLEKDVRVFMKALVDGTKLPEPPLGNVHLAHALTRYRALNSLMTRLGKRDGSNFNNITAFSEEYHSQETQAALAAGADPKWKRYRAIVGRILKTALTLGGYAIYSKAKRGSFKFWKSGEEIHQEKIKHRLSKHAAAQEELAAKKIHPKR